MKTARKSDELTALKMFVTCKLKGVFSAADACQKVNTVNGNTQKIHWEKSF